MKSKAKKRSTQLDLISLTKSEKYAKNIGFGGEHLKGNPRMARPLESKKTMHFVLRSKLAKGRNALNHPGRKRAIEKLMFRHIDANGIKVYSHSINSNHIHILMQVYRRKDYQKFVRSFTGIVARLVLQIQRGKGKVNLQTVQKVKFWSARPFTRIVNWGRSFYEAKFYVTRNQLEAIGYVSYIPRHLKVPKILSG